jgi:arabinogalactan endo-1,4-beta-galactosidase
LWPEGDIDNQAEFIMLLKKGVQGVREAKPAAKVLVHFAGINGSDWFYGVLQNNLVDYDIIALSYYPRFHTKNLNEVSNALFSLTNSYGKEIVLAETAYPFTLGWNDFTNNIVGLEEHLVSGYPATEEGQRAFMLKLRQIVAETNGGIGIAYWAPEWVAFRGDQATDGSVWENMALFDFELKALSGMEVFEE